MIDFTSKSSNATKKVLQMTDKQIQERIAQENAALTLCGGRLSNCYILSEVIESLAIDALAGFAKEKWYKQAIKKAFKTSVSELHKSIVKCNTNSVTSSDFMREVADAMGEVLEPDLFKLENAILFELNKRKIANSTSIAKMLLIQVLFDCIKATYDVVIEGMKEIYDAYYDSWYDNARCNTPSYWWGKAMDLYGKAYIPENLDLNNITAIDNGIKVISNKLYSEEVAVAVRAKAEEFAGKDDTYERLLETKKVLGL